MAVPMKSHTGIIAVGIFLFFGAAMALLAGISSSDTRCIQRENCYAA
jgi:hypothetical protein